MIKNKPSGHQLIGHDGLEIAVVPPETRLKLEPVENLGEWSDLLAEKYGIHF